jgi:hypothetical protein
MAQSTTDPVRQWVQLVCEDLVFLRNRASSSGGDSPERLTALVEVAAAGRADQAWVDELLELLRKLGVPAATAERGWPFPDDIAGGLPRYGEGAPTMDVYRCPQFVCGRAEVRRPGHAEPVCAVFGVSLSVAGEQ